MARIIIGFQPGGATDAIARVIGDAISPILQQRIVVESRPGANGVLAAAYIAQSPPDGTLIYQCPMSTVAITPQVPGQNLPLDPGLETVPIANVALSSYGVVVAKGSPYRNFAQILEVERQRPGSVSFASTGVGSVQHLSGEYMNQLAGLSMVHVPYRGSAAAVIDILGGRVDFMFTNLGDVTRQIQSGDLQLLGQGDASRFPLFPDAPRVSDTLAGFDVTGWFGFCGHKELSREQIDRWSSAIGRAMRDEALLKRLQDLGFTPHFEDSQTLARRLTEDRARWSHIIQSRNVQAN
nr:tripartite tricarboxylate transporter substrate binding protein [uncultured Roseococcus sp.]